MEKISFETSLDGIPFSDKKIDLSFLTLGSHIFAVSATDEAGNTSLVESVFFVSTNVESILADFEAYFGEGLIPYCFF